MCKRTHKNIKFSFFLKSLFSLSIFEQLTKLSVTFIFRLKLNNYVCYILNVGSGKYVSIAVKIEVFFILPPVSVIIKYYSTSYRFLRFFINSNDILIFKFKMFCLRLILPSPTELFSQFSSIKLMLQIFILSLPIL
jgi:hypothetical protein